LKALSLPRTRDERIVSLVATRLRPAELLRGASATPKWRVASAPRHRARSV